MRMNESNNRFGNASLASRNSNTGVGYVKSISAPCPAKEN